MDRTRGQISELPVKQALAVQVELADRHALVDPAALMALRLLAEHAARVAGRVGEVRVELVPDAEMAAAHLKYSNVPGTTDVLTFDLSDGLTARTGAPLDVDILVCVDEARRQATERGHALEHEILLYILHGILHCLGHDDHEDDAFARMHAEEDRILTAIGIGPVFHSRGGA